VVAIADDGVELEPHAVRDLLLVGLTFSSGAVDAISYLALGKIFTAFMTGNLVFLGLAIAGQGTADVVHASVAVAAFAVGVVLSQQIVKHPGGPTSWPRRVSIALAVVAVTQAGFLVVWLATPGRPTGGAGELLVGLSALAMGMQSGAVRALGVNAVFTTAATATLIALAGDLGGGARSAVERRRLAAVIVGLVAGAAAGSVLLVHARPFAAVLPLVVTALVCAAALVALGKDQT
jgi:uncharacterized membrane protein YoaK (UPF0700 family)